MKSGIWLGTLLLATPLMAQTPAPLWPDGVPGERAAQGEERDATTKSDGSPGGRPVIRLSDVANPTVTYYPPKAKTGLSHSALLVLPGGGYRILAYDLEGEEVCQWAASVGLHSFLVKYRVPQPKTVQRFEQPLADVRQAMEFARSKAKTSGFATDSIGVLGFSAGGHLAAVAANDTQIRPAFAVLIYPAYLSVNDEGKVLAAETEPRTDVPMFIVQTQDDLPYVRGTTLYSRVLVESKRPVEMHLFAKGGHGYGLRPTAMPVTHWPGLLRPWLEHTLSGKPPNGNQGGE